MNAREERGLVIAATCRLARNADGTWKVPSQTKRGDNSFYVVDVQARTCTCLDHTEGGQTCKHFYAASIVHQRDVLPDGTVIEQKTFTFTEKKIYRQDWRAYNLAQSIEKHRFQELLFELTRGVEELPVKATGRKPHSTKDQIFAMALKVYCTLSSRRVTCDFKDAFDAGYFAKEIPNTKVCHFFDNPAFAPILKGLIAHSALPLRAVETNFAIDSSGFGSSRFERWYDERYGVTRQKCVWVKAHIACGVKTNVVTAIRILDKDAGDCPQFIPLARETRQGFVIEEMSADKAYASLDNFEEIAKMGGQAYIAFKSNTKGRVGGAFEKAFHYFSLHEAEYMEHYHRRSNVESTFSAIKRKFGHDVRSKTDSAMVNEVLCKVLAHNICVLIQEQCELGIEPVFWPKEERERKDVLPITLA